MGLGSTARKVQKLADLAEKLYGQVQDVRERVAGIDEDLEATTERVEHVETEQRRQRALLEAIAEEHGVDVEQVVDAADTDEGEGDTVDEAVAGDDTAGADEAAAVEETDDETPEQSVD